MVYLFPSVTCWNPVNGYVLSDLAKNNEIFVLTRRVAVEYLGKIASGNPIAIETLASLIKNKDEDDLLNDSRFGISTTRVIELLWEIDSEKVTAIDTLTWIIETPEKNYKKQAIKYLIATESGKQKAIKAIISLINNSDTDYYDRKEAIELLIKIDSGNQQVINTLIDWLNNSDIDEKNRESFIGLWVRRASVNLRESQYSIFISKDEFPNDESLRKIWHQNAIQNLITIIKDNKNHNYHHIHPAFLLWKIKPGHQEALNAFIDLIREPGTDNVIRSTIIESFKEIVDKEILTEKQFQGIVTILKDSFVKNDFDSYEQYKDCYKFIWYCTQNLSYPNFYQAWYPENFNFAEFPQLLQDAVNSESITPSPLIIFIDRNLFIDSDNPALDIYDKMLNQQCPDWQSTLPDTMQKIKLYCTTLKRNYKQQKLLLIFYETSIKGKYKGFSKIFLDALKTFQGKICFVTPYSVDISLKQFSTNQPQSKLIAEMLEWIK